MLQGFQDEVVDIKSRQLDTQTYDVTLSVDFDGEHFASKREPLLEQAYKDIDSYDDFRAFAGDYAEQIISDLSTEIDKIEEEIRKAVPKAKHIDIEPEG